MADLAGKAQSKLGKREIDSLTCPPGKRDILVFDAVLPGFGVRVTEGGAKVFLYQYRYGGRVRRLVLGDYGLLTPPQARDLAEAARVKVRAGGDPVGERKAVQADAAAAHEAASLRKKADLFTFAKLAEEWVATALKDHSTSYSREAGRALRVNFPTLAGRAADGINASDAQTAIDAIAKDRGEALARRSLAYARAMYGWGLKRRLVPGNVFKEVHAEGRNMSRDRALSDAELGEVWRALDGLGGLFAPCLRLLVLTLQRREEVAGMRWAELSPDLSLWTLPAARSKNRKAHLIHLPEAARAVLRRVPRMQGCPYVFSTTGKTSLSGFSKAKERLDTLIAAKRTKAAAEAGRGTPEAMPEWRLHDLRRTGVTTLARLGTPPHVADKLLNHAEAAGIRGVAAVYQRHDFLNERQAALEIWATHVVKSGN